MRIIELFWKNEHGTVVADIAKAGAAIAFISIVATHLVSGRDEPFDRDRMDRVASAAAAGKPIDALVTGSILKSAAATKLDPCAVQR